VITYILLCGYPPFWDKNENEATKKAIRGIYEFGSPDWDEISPQAKAFISDLIKVDPGARLTAKTALSHEWFTSKSRSETNLAEKVGDNLVIHLNAKRKLKVFILFYAGWHGCHQIRQYYQKNWGFGIKIS
jgi:serine/threonine protein kinase